MPCYYSNNIVEKALTMLSWQTRKDQIKVYLINDCSPNTNCEYQDLIHQFESKLNIIYLKTAKNSGPGAARELGIKYCDCEWIMFHDDDDMLNNPYVIEQYLSLLDRIGNNPRVISIEGVHLEPQTFSKQCGVLNGKLFKTDFIKQFNLDFGNLKYEEDRYFLTQYVYYMQMEEKCEVSVIADFPNFISYTKQNNNINSICRTLSEKDKFDNALQMLNKIFSFYLSKKNNKIIEKEFYNDFRYFINWVVDRIKTYNYDNIKSNNDFMVVHNQILNLINLYPNAIPKEEIKSYYDFFNSNIK